ncbi:putative bifunctional diguanylate cyclase/phosphodiesterase [Cohnella caldifontis]|uniref:putative bifunctional diguanylate cyclase/phosphodiesterase n=1 Tax=Cohnella caldifontis TaxID=3027471 RepID=UPI0023EDB741|nr:EAL domain-containing protein [Cohnella sp. YIM B05605]
MSINRAEMRTVWTVLAAAAAFAVLQLWRGQPDRFIAWIGFVNTELLLDSFSFALCFALLAIGWMIFVPTLCRLRMLTAALFLAIGILDLIHLMSLPGMPLYGVGFGNGDTLLEWMSQGLSGVGLPFLFAMRNAGAHPRSRLYATAAVALLAGGLVSTAFLSRHADAARLASAHPYVQGALLLLYAFTAGMILYRNRQERPQAMLTIVQGLAWLAFSRLEELAALGRLSVQYADLFKLAGYYCLLKGIYYVSIEEPLKKQKKIESRINYLAFHDELTGLPNRRMFGERVQAEMNRAVRGNGRFALLWLDLDRFKTINDSMGHAFGDQLLVAVADRLTNIAEKPERLFRMGGDEFTLLLPDVAKAVKAEEAAERLMEAFRQPFRIGPSAFHVSVSVGIALFPDDGSSLDLLQQNADTAMYSAKESGNGWKRYLPEMNRKAKERLLLENDLRIALELGQFRLVYQPLVDLESGKLVGTEALLRWNHPQRGEVPPSEFIPLCEENGFILPLGEWVLRTACFQMKEWQQKGYPPIVMAVNLSIRQFRQHDLCERIRGVLEETGVDAGLLELEITESIMADVGYAAKTLERLKEIGVRISIDDFGTGYSSLHYLKRFPIDKLKIDRSFVSDVLVDRNDAAIVSGISAMARNLNLKVTAEGVESEGQVSFLKEQKCQEAQGYYFSKPVAPQTLEELFQSEMAG